MSQRDWLGRNRRLLLVLVGIGVAATAADRALAQFVLRQDVVAATGGTVRNACFALSNTVGEAVASPATAGNFKLFSGFWGARPTVVQDSLFRNGFEDCSP